MKKIKVDNIAVSVVMFIVCATLMCVMFMQFKTVEETDITAIENMREAELRETLSEWKSKYEQTATKLEENNKKINEYREKINNNEKASVLISKELEQSRVKVGKTDVEGEGVIVTLNDNEEMDIQALDLLELVNQLRYAGAEAISINDIRVINSTEIVDLDSYSYISVGERRVTAPYTVKAIGNKTYLSSTLNLKKSGFIDRAKNDGKSVEMEESKKVTIPKYNGDMKYKYLKDGEE